MGVDPEAEAARRRRRPVTTTREDLRVHGPAEVDESSEAHEPAVSTVHEVVPREGGVEDLTTLHVPTCASCSAVMREQHVGAVCPVCRGILCQGCAGHRCVLCGHSVCMRHSVSVGEQSVCSPHFLVVVGGWLLAFLIVGGLLAAAFLLNP